MVDFTPIGIAHSPFRKAGAPPVHSTFTHAKGSIEVFAEYREGLGSIEGFSHLIILYHFHRSDRRALTEPPLIDGQTPHGIFSTRHFNRPNPIGISYVNLEKVTEGILYVNGMDLLDNTPVLDIKPYIPAFDCIADAGTGWVSAQHIEKIRNVSLLTTRDIETGQPRHT